MSGAVRPLRPLPRTFFQREVLTVARELLGQFLVRRRGRRLLVARLVEVEAYGGQGVDPSAHSFRGCTPRCRVMFGPAGHAYVYTTHQGRCCLNVSAVGDRSGQAVIQVVSRVRHGPSMTLRWRENIRCSGRARPARSARLGTDDLTQSTSRPTLVD